MRRFDEEEDGTVGEMAKDIQSAEKKMRTLLDKRDALNGEARVQREERDQLNDARREAGADLDMFKERREAANAKMREHKEKRNAFQAEAKELIAKKKAMFEKRDDKGPSIMELKKEIEDAHRRQETSQLSLEKERALLEDIKRKERLLKEYMSTHQADEEVMGDINKLNARIDELFKQADGEHQLFVEAMNEGQVHHEKFVEVLKQMDHLRGEADKRHEEYVDLRQRADNYHQRVDSIREEIMEKRKERDAIIQEARDVIAEQNRETREALESEDVIDEALDEALDILKKKGSIKM